MEKDDIYLCAVRVPKNPDPCCSVRRCPPGTPVMVRIIKAGPVLRLLMGDCTCDLGCIDNGGAAEDEPVVMFACGDVMEKLYGMTPGAVMAPVAVQSPFAQPTCGKELF